MITQLKIQFENSNNELKKQKKEISKIQKNANNVIEEINYKSKKETFLENKNLKVK